MRTVQDWLDAYGESHQDPVNKTIHWICIPPIMLTLVALLSLIPTPVEVSPFLHWGSLFVLGVCFWYVSLSPRLALGMAVIGTGLVLGTYGLSLLPVPLWISALSIFVVAWIGQFIGHKIEGKKPSFLDDLRFLLIGPLFVLGFLYRRFHLAY